MCRPLKVQGARLIKEGEGVIIILLEEEEEDLLAPVRTEEMMEISLDPSEGIKRINRLSNYHLDWGCFAIEQPQIKLSK